MEVLPINDPIKRLVANSEPVNIIQKAAVEEGMRPLLYDGWLKVKKGITTIEEIMRVINLSWSFPDQDEFFVYLFPDHE